MAKLADALNNPIVTTVDLIRHGEPAGGEKYRGSQDDPLSELGWAQMRAATTGSCPWDVIVSSPLKRCAEFAQELAANIHRPLHLEPEFRELCFGVWEGQRPEQLKQQNPQQLLNFWLNPLTHAPPQSEPFAAFSQRIQNAWQRLLADYAGQHVLLVCHGAVIRVLLSLATAMPLEHSFRWHVAHASLSRLQIYSEQGGPHHGRQVPTLAFHGRSSVAA